MPSKPVVDISDPRYVKALSHPLRVRILALLQERTASPRELAGWLNATLGTVSYHVRTLHDVGLLELVETTQVRGAIAHFYRARAVARASGDAWEAVPPVAKQANVGASLQMIDEYARAAAAAGGFDRREAHLSRTNLRLDDKGWQQAAKACQSLIAQLDKIEAAAGKRLGDDADNASPAALGLLFFEAVQLTQPEQPQRRTTRQAKRRPARSAKAASR